jgi:ribosomal protein S12 methylthiotransferase accessory factor
LKKEIIVKDKVYIPRFAAAWAHTENSIEISTVGEIISFVDMPVKLILQIEEYCSGENSLEEVVGLLSAEWDKAEVVSLLELLIDKHIIVNSLTINPTSQSKRLNRIKSIVPNEETRILFKLPYEVIYGNTGSGIWSSAQSPDFSVARDKLISEIAEWGAWSHSVDRPTFVCDSTSMSKYIHPDSVVSYHDSQYADDSFRLTKFDTKSVYEWIEGRNVTSDEKVFFLADNVLYPYTPKHARHSFTTSSGCAAHTNRRDAIKHAVYELVERDAFMIYWLNKLDCPSIQIESLPKDILSRIRLIQSFGYNIVLRYIDMDISPVVMVAVRDGLGNYVTMGLSASDNLFDMIYSAISEVEIALMHLIGLDKVNTSIEPNEVVSLTQHEKLHQQGKYQNQTDFIFDQSGKSLSYRDLNTQYEDVSDIVQSVVKNGLTVYVVDATKWGLDILLPDHRYIVRAIVPGLIPLSFGFNLEPLGMSRIYDVPCSLGYRKNKTPFEELNRFPHPLN